MYTNSFNIHLILLTINTFYKSPMQLYLNSKEDSNNHFEKKVNSEKFSPKKNTSWCCVSQMECALLLLWLKNQNVCKWFMKVHRYNIAHKSAEMSDFEAGGKMTTFSGYCDNWSFSVRFVFILALLDLVLKFT